MRDSFSRRTIMQSLLAGMAMPLAGGAAGSAALPTEVLTVAQGKLDHHPFGDQRTFWDGATGQLKSLTVGSIALKPGDEPHPPHQHPEEEILLITAGHGTIFVEGKTTAVQAGDLMYSAGNRLHGIRAAADSEMTFYYFKWLGK
jgi:mannose-6-phosphate isomerase-like protein (cupin superfamily)